MKTDSFGTVHGALEHGSCKTYMNDTETRQYEVALKRFAWMGISFLIPETWALGKYQGTYDQGMLRIDDLVQERITLLWKRVRETDVAHFVETHLQETEKQAKQNRLPFESQRNLRRLQGGGELFWWKSDVEAYNVCVREGKENARLALLRILAAPGEQMRALTESIAESIEMDKGGKEIRWAVYGLDLRLPRSMIPTDFSFKTGGVRLTFDSPNERLAIEKFAPANVIMQGLSLFDWLQSFKRKELSAYNFTGDAEKVQGHSAAHFHGKARSRWTRGFRNFEYWGWVCDRENRLLSFLHQMKRPDKSVMKFDLGKVWCHLPAGAESAKKVRIGDPAFGSPLPSATGEKRTGAKGLNRVRMLLAIPVRNEAVRWHEMEGQVEIEYDLHLRWGGAWLKRLMGADKARRFTLDEMGGFVWQMIDGTRNVRELVDRLAEKYKLEQVESHAALLAFLRNMMKKRLVGLYVPEEP